MRLYVNDTDGTLYFEVRLETEMGSSPDLEKPNWLLETASRNT